MRSAMFIYGALVVLGVSDALPIALQSKSLKREVTLKSPRRLSSIDGIQQLGNDITDENDINFGRIVISGDGSTVVIGASLYGTSQAISGTDPDTGQAYSYTGMQGKASAYRWDGTTWNQLGSDIVGEGHGFAGSAVSISSDGNIVAIASYMYNGGTGDRAGHVRIFTYDGTSWIQLGEDIDGETAHDFSGNSVSLSSDGSVVAIGAKGNDGAASMAGHVRVYRYDGASWIQRGSDMDGEAISDVFGTAVSISSNGNTVAIGAPGWSRGSYAGRAAVYRWDDTDWTQLGSNILGEDPDEGFGVKVSISSDGTIVAIGATSNDDAGNDAGVVRVFGLDGTDWTQLGSDIEGEAAGDGFGNAVSISSDGTVVSIGCRECDDTRIFNYDGTTWLELGTIVTNGYDGGSISSDGTSVATASASLGKAHVFSIPASWISPSAPPSAPSSSNLDEVPSTGSSQGDPHLHFAHGGTADFRGTNGTFYAIHSAPGLQFAAKTVDVDFLLPRPQLVHGSFWTQTAWSIRGTSGRQFAIHSDANAEGFKVVDLDDGSQVADRMGVWKEWSVDGIRALFKQSTLSVRANGWEMNVTRHPIYNYVSGSSHWRFDLELRPFDGTTGFESIYGKASETCYPHGIIGQSFDGDNVAVNGAIDDYTFDPERPVITTKAMAEGAIEGVASDYALKGATDKAFPFSRYDKTADAACAARKLEKLSGKKGQSSAQDHAGSVDEPSLA